MIESLTAGACILLPLITVSTRASGALHSFCQNFPDTVQPFCRDGVSFLSSVPRKRFQLNEHIRVPPENVLNGKNAFCRLVAERRFSLLEKQQRNKRDGFRPQFHRKVTIFGQHSPHP
jgi:hypothetical protein